jgi:AbrB family looped-hinge helix DNA binding protein
MDAVTVSPKFQVVIPEQVRREQRIHPGDKLAVIVKHGVLHLVPILPLEKTKGIHRRIGLKGLRDQHDRF